MMERKKKAKEKGEVFGAKSQMMMMMVMMSSKFKLVIIPSKLREVNILIYNIYFN